MNIINIEERASGYLYVLSNPYMEGVLKIGASRHGGSKRAEELRSSGVPANFKLEFEIMSDDVFSDESNVHYFLRNHRASEDREFFKVDLDLAIFETIKAVIHGRFGREVCIGTIDQFIAREDVPEKYNVSIATDAAFMMAERFGDESKGTQILSFAILNKLSSGAIYDAVRSIREVEIKEIIGGGV